MNLRDFKKHKLPDSPGIYFFTRKPFDKTQSKEILYIGKATSIKDRVRSYFSNDIISTRGSRIVDMVTLSDNIDFQETDSVLEALILEANLIKKHQPKYNIKEKDNKSYSFVVISKLSTKSSSLFQSVSIERGRTLDFSDKTKYSDVFGPFPSKGQLEEALKIIRKIFPFFTNKKPSNFYKQLGLEPDISQADANKEYSKNIRHLKLFLKGKKKELVKKLEKEMSSLAKQQEFERANKVKRQIFALQHLNDISLIKKENINAQINSDSESDFRIESYDISHMNGENSVGVMTVVEDGEVKKSDYRKFILRRTKRGDDVGGIKEILERRLKHDEWPLPDLFVIDGGITQRNVTVKVLKEFKLNKSISIVSVVKDDKHKPLKFLGPEKIAKKYKNEILLSNSEAHRFAINFFRSKQRKSFRK